MFEIMPGKGFALTLKEGHRLEVDFGPLSQSDNKSISKQAFAATGGKSRTAEIRQYGPNDGSKPSMVKNDATVEELASIILGYSKSLTI